MNMLHRIFSILTLDTVNIRGFPGVSAVKNLPALAGEAGDISSIPGLGRCPGGGHGNLLQYCCLENLMDTGAWQATVQSHSRIN